ncbi:MAG: hypothetical protein KAH57_08325 [Thermoplasmata archaeon]|nr:hypothetical protein [Thermoplasmata archaeon]
MSSFSGDLPIRREAPIATIEKRVPPMMIEKNIKAFEAGEKAFRDWLTKKTC